MTPGGSDAAGTRTLRGTFMRQRRNLAALWDVMLWGSGVEWRLHGQGWPLCRTRPKEEMLCLLATAKAAASAFQHPKKPPKGSLCFAVQRANSGNRRKEHGHLHKAPASKEAPCWSSQGPGKQLTKRETPAPAASPSPAHKRCLQAFHVSAFTSFASSHPACFPQPLPEMNTLLLSCRLR